MRRVRACTCDCWLLMRKLDFVLSRLGLEGSEDGVGESNSEFVIVVGKLMKR